MTRPRTVPLGIALALAVTATTASAATYYREVYVSPAPVEVVRVERPARVVTYEERYVVAPIPASEPVADLYVAPRETLVVRGDPIIVTAPARPLPSEWNPRHPEWGHLIDHGLFNRYGQNDFGR